MNYSITDHVEHLHYILNYRIYCFVRVYYNIIFFTITSYNNKNVFTKAFHQIYNRYFYYNYNYNANIFFKLILSIETH